MAFGKRSKSRTSVTLDLPEEQSAEFDHGGNENQRGREKTGGKKKGGFVIRWLKQQISKRRDCAPKESKRYDDEHESKRCDEDDDNDSSMHQDDDNDSNDSRVLDLHDDDNTSSALDLHDDEDDDNSEDNNSSVLDLHDDEDDDNSEDSGIKAQHDHTSLMHRGGENVNQMGSPGNIHAYPASYNTHMYPANNMYAYPDNNSAYHTYAYPSYNSDYNMHAYTAYNANAYPAYNSASMHGAMHEYPTNNMNMPSNSVPPIDHTFAYFTEENPACAIM